MPQRRIIKPLVAAAVLVSVLAIANRELLIPSVRDKLANNAQNWLGDNERWDELAEVEEALFTAIADDAIALQLALLRSGDRWWRRAGETDMAWRRYDEATTRFPESERAKARMRALARK